jgi:hypothetical protein
MEKPHGWGIYFGVYLEQHKPTPNPSQEGHCLFPSWEGLGVGLNLSPLHFKSFNNRNRYINAEGD